MRRTWINVHLFIAAFFAPIVLMVAASGGFYLIDYKGNVEKTPLELPAGASLDLDAPALEQDVRALLAAAGEEADFEYLRMGSGGFVTRPTSTTHYQFSVGADGVTATRNEPSLVAAIIELHKGHGPGLFRSQQIVLAVALLLMVISGVVTGLMAPAFRNRTLATMGVGAVVFVAALLI